MNVCESGEDDKDEAEKDSCTMFHHISENLNCLDKELALVLCKNISSQFGLRFIDNGGVTVSFEVS